MKENEFQTFITWESIGIVAPERIAVVEENNKKGLCKELKINIIKWTEDPETNLKYRIPRTKWKIIQAVNKLACWEWLV